MALSYGDSTSEHRAVRSRAGLIDRSNRGKLRLTGKDRADFLNGMVTNDIKSLRTGFGLWTAMTTDKAKMLADARVYCLEGALWIDLEPELPEKIHNHLERYTFTADITIENLTESWGLLSVYGPSSPDILNALISSGSIPPHEYSIRSVSIEGNELLIARNEISGEIGYDFLIRREPLPWLWARLLKIGRAGGLVPAGLDALESLRIEAGLPRYGVDMDDSNFPMEAGLDKKAISYTKGCYIGQETIARADARGHMNKRLVGLELTGRTSPPKGQPILSGSDSKKSEDRPIGTVTCGTPSPTLGKVIAMGYLNRDFAVPGTEVVIDGQPATVVPLPFYRSSR